MIQAVGAAASSRVNQGKCPHGMPMGACPICNGMQGGGGGGAKRSKEAVPGMTWDECYAIGRMLQARANRVEDAKQFQMNVLAQVMMQNKMIQAIARFMSATANFVQNNIVQPVANFANKVTTAVMRPVRALGRMIMNSPMVQAMRATSNFIKQGMANISDKLAAVFGEPMTAVSNFLSENWRKFKLKKFIFFEEVDTGMEQGEQDEEVELKRILSLKTFKKNIHRLFNNKKRNKAWS